MQHDVQNLRPPDFFHLNQSGEDDGYYSPRSDSTFASFSERSQALDDASGRAFGQDLAKSPSSSKQVQCDPTLACGFTSPTLLAWLYYNTLQPYKKIR